VPRALVTGAAGFVGGALVRRLLADGWEVHALLGPTCRREALAPVRDRITAHDHDGGMERMLAIVRAARPDVAFHLASLFLTDHRPDQLQDLVASNILLGAQLAEALAAAGPARLVNTGTSWQHFGTGGYRPVNLYAATKQALEDLLAYYHDARGLACTTLKLFDTYGPRDPRPKLVRLLLEAARSGAPLGLSPGEQVLDLVHVDDVAAAFAHAAGRLLAEPEPRLERFLVAGERLTVRQLVAVIEAATGRPVAARWGERPYRPREVMEPLAAGAGLRLPGWAPAIPLRDGLAQAYREG
jgi:nucleoside-diphosphate-sugar epimerase